MSMKHTSVKPTQLLTLTTENASGVLRRVAGILSRKGHNISSFHSDPTDDPEVSIMTITVECDENEARFMVLQLLRLYDVFSVDLKTNLDYN